jgi:hypothetical protein
MAGVLGKLATTVATFVIATAMAIVPTLAAGAVPSDDNSLIVSDPLPNYTPASDGPFDGRIDAGTLMQVAGAKANEIPDAVHDLVGQARTWRSIGGSSAVVIVINCGDENKAADFLQGALDGKRKSSGAPFDSGLAGTAGFAAERAGVSIHSVSWRQSKYYVEVFVSAGSDGSSEADSKMLAARQVAYGRSSFGAAPTIDASASGQDSTESSNFYKAGEITGWLCLAGGVVAIVWVIRRRRTKRQGPLNATSVPPDASP